MKLVFDLEANTYIVKDLTVIHCISTTNWDTGEKKHFGPDEILQGLDYLEEAKELIGHNVIDYDIPALKFMYPQFNPKGKQVDTLVMSRVAYPHRKELDFSLHKQGKLPPAQIGRHGLESWGHRLGLHKGDFGKQENAWEVYTEEMGEYCDLDVEVTCRLYDKLLNSGIPIDVYDMEHEIYVICLEQRDYGFPFDMGKAIEFHRKLLKHNKELKDQITKLLGGPFLHNLGTFIPKRTLRYKDPLRACRYEGAEFTKIELVPFNPNSRAHVANRLVERIGWEPKAFDANGSPNLNEETIKTIDNPIKDILDEYFMVEKRLASLSNGKQAWMKVVGVDGRIHGTTNTMGAGTSRCTHTKPNMSQIPKVSLPYGKECRGLFTAGREDWLVFDTDLSGIELRVMAHYMYPWDKGAYGDIILNGDIHTENQKAAGLPTRDLAKTFIYAKIYGSGIAGLAETCSMPFGKMKKTIASFERNLPALSTLTEAVKKKHREQGYLRGLDGRIVPTRSEHSALNFLFQSAGAIISKRWVIEARKIMDARGYIFGKHYAQVAFIHDQYDLVFDPKVISGEELGEISKIAIDKTQAAYGIRMPLDIAWSVGKDFSEVH